MSYFKNIFQRKSEEAKQRRAERSRAISETEKKKQEIESTANRINEMVQELKKAK